MYTRRNRCLPTFHSTSTISSPSERATRSAAPRIFSKSTQRLLDPSRFAVHSYRPNKKVGLRPLLRATCFRAKTEYIPAARQKQDTPPRPSRTCRKGTHPLLAFVFVPTSRNLSRPGWKGASLPPPAHQYIFVEQFGNFSYP